MSSIAPKMSDFCKHSNDRPRPLGEVKAESVCFDFFDDNPSITRTFQSKTDIDIMNRLHENLITTALIADVSSANAEEFHKKSGNAQNPALGSSFSAMHLISSLVSPRPRAISIPKQRNPDFPRYDLRINTAPNQEHEMDGIDVCDSQGETSVSNGHHQNTEWQQRSPSRHSNWGEYRRQLSTTKKRDLTRKLTELSKCEAVDIMDPLQSSTQQYSTPMLIMSQYQRDEENEVLNAKAEALLQRSRNLPSAHSIRRKRPMSLARETAVVSRSLKKQNGHQEIGQIPNGIVGRNIQNSFGLAPESCMGEEGVYSSRAGGSSRLWRRIPTSKDRQNSSKSRDSTATQAPSTKTKNDGQFNVQGKSLPRLPKQNSYTENLRLLQKKKQNEHLPFEFDEFEHLQQHVHVTLSEKDKFWKIPEGIKEVTDHRNVTNGFRAPRKLPSRLPPYNEALHAQNLVHTRNKTPTYKSYRDNLAARRGIRSEKNGQLSGSVSERVTDSDLLATFRLTELNEDEIMDMDSEGDDLTDTDEDDEERITPVCFGEEELTRQPLGTGKYQGPTSRISDEESGSQFHVVNGDNCDVEEDTYKILKALDQDVYFDFEHKKYRRTGYAGSLGNPENPRVHFLKVKINKCYT